MAVDLLNRMAAVDGILAALTESSKRSVRIVITRRTVRMKRSGTRTEATAANVINLRGMASAIAGNPPFSSSLHHFERRSGTVASHHHHRASSPAGGCWATHGDVGSTNSPYQRCCTAVP